MEPEPRLDKTYHRARVPGIRKPHFDRFVALDFSSAAKTRRNGPYWHVDSPARPHIFSFSSHRSSFSSSSAIVVPVAIIGINQGVTATPPSIV